MDERLGAMRNQKVRDTELDELCVTQPFDWRGAFENLRNALRDTYLTISVIFCQISFHTGLPPTGTQGGTAPIVRGC